jgi:hypothetical protein
MGTCRRNLVPSRRPRISRRNASGQDPPPARDRATSPARGEGLPSASGRLREKGGSPGILDLALGMALPVHLDDHVGLYGDLSPKPGPQPAAADFAPQRLLSRPPSGP